MWDAGFDEISFSEERYDTFSDAPQASSAEAYGTQGVNIWAVKPAGPRRGTGPHSALTQEPEKDASAGGSLPQADAVYDAGSLGCADGPLTEIAATLQEMPPGSVLEVRSADPAVGSDLPSWCRMVGHTFLGGGQGENAGRYFVQRNAP